jgi:hypothetical protein
VPAELRYPLPPDHNPILTVEVDGTAESVWLSPRVGSADRLVLQASLPGRYQIQLGDQRVVALLRAAGPRGEFAIHAREPGDATTSSVPIRYAFERARPVRAELVVHREDGVEDVEPRAFRPSWHDPAGVQRFEWRYGAGDELVPVELLAGGVRVPVAIDTGERSASAAIGDELRAAWSESGALRVEVDGEVATELRARPDDLALASADEARITLEQRRSALWRARAAICACASATSRSARRCSRC